MMFVKRKTEKIKMNLVTTSLRFLFQFSIMHTDQKEYHNKLALEVHSARILRSSISVLCLFYNI